MAAAQQTDTEISKLQPSTSSLQLQPLPLPTSNLTLLCDVSSGVPRPYVPQQFRHTFLIHCTPSHTLAFVPLNTSSHHDMSGLISTKMYVSGLNIVYNIRNLTFNVTNHSTTWQI